MDYDNPQFIAAVKKLLSGSEPIRQNEAAPHTEGESSKQPDHPQMPIPPTTTPQPECHLPKAHCEITCTTEKDWWDKAKPYVEMAGVVLLFVYTLYTIKMYCANKKAADAAKSAADTAHNALVLANRPWIKIKHRIVKPLNFEFVGAAGRAATMTVENTVENVGNGVALNVISWEDVIPVDPDLSTRSARKRREEWCNANKRFDPSSPTTLNGYVLFPHDPSIQEAGMGPLMSTVQKAVEANALSPHLHHGTGPNPLAGKVAFVMIGCVVYGSPLDTDGARPYMTTFLYDLAEPVEGGAIFPWVTPQGTADKLRLVQMPDGSSAY